VESEGYIDLTLQSNGKPKTTKNDHRDPKKGKLGRFLRDTAMATIVMPLTLVAAASTLAFLMALMW
jgi:hypothetical protein